MGETERPALVERYRQGTEAVLESLEGATQSELDARPGPGEWSAREIVHHLADSEITSAIRLRRLLAEDHPVIYGYDEMRFAQRLSYDRPIEASLEAFRGARRSTAELLDLLTDEQWGREGWHTELGPYGVETWLERAAAHALDHADQIRRARAAAGGS